MRRLIALGSILLLFGFFSVIASAGCTGAGTTTNPYVCASSTGLSRGSAVGAFGSSTVDASSIPFGSKIQSVAITLTTVDGSPDDEYYVLVAPTGTPNNTNTQNLVFMGGVGGGSSFNGTIVFADGNPNLPDTVPTAGRIYEPSVNADTGAVTFSSGAPSTIHYAQPFGTATLSSQFLGANPTGKWTLYGYSAANDGSTATVSSWSLSIVLAAGTPSSTTVSVTPTPVFTSGPSSTATITATVEGSPSNPTVGTVAFTDNGVTISGCASVALNSSSQAACTETFNTGQEGTHIISATYTYETLISSVTSTGTKGLQVDNVTTNPTAGRYCNTGTIAVPGVQNITANPYPSHIYAPLSNAISSVTLTVGGFTTPGGDAGTVDMMLVSPDGTPFVPMNKIDGQVGETAITAAADGFGFTLSDAGTAFPFGGALSNTSYRPLTFVPAGNWPASQTVAGPPSVAAVNFASTLGNATFGTAFNGKIPNGGGDIMGQPWSLYIVSGLEVGSSPSAANINGWCLNFATGSAAPTNTVVQSSENPSFVGDSVTFAAKVSNGTNPVTQGTVTFFVDGASVQAATSLSADGTATYVASALAEGTHTVQAFYSGFGTTLAVSNGTLSQEVDRHTVISNGNRTFCNLGGVSIPVTGSATPYASKIFVTNLPGTVKSVTTNLNNYTIQAPETVDTMLVGPTNTNLVFMSHVAGTAGAENSLSGANLTFADSGFLPALPIGPLTSGSAYIPSAYVAEPSIFPPPAPANPTYAGPEGSGTFGSQFGGIAGDGPWELFTLQDETKTSGSIGSWCLNFVTNPVSFSVNVSHNGAGAGSGFDEHFAQGQAGVQIFVTITNNGPGPTGDTVTVTDTLNNALTLTGTSGTDWNCSVVGQTVTCTNSDAIVQGAAYPTLTLTVNVSPFETGTFTNSVTVSGGGSNGTLASDTITVDTAPVLSVSKTHTGSFVENQTAEWDLTISNIAANGTTAGTVNVQDMLPAGYTLNSFSGAGNLWSCTGTGTVNCTGVLGLTAGNSTLLRLFVNVPASSPASVSNTAGVWGGGDLHHISVASESRSNTDTVSVTPSVQIIVATSVTGPTVTVDAGTPFTGAQTFTWTPGSTHTIGTTTPQPGTTGTQYVWLNWSDGGAISHSITASTNTTYTANFQTQYQLTTTASPSADGSISPPTGYFAAGTTVPVSATPNAGFSFIGFSGALSGTTTPQNVTISGPVSVTANFSAAATNLTLTTTSKTGPANARVWGFNVGNTGPGSATGAQMTSFTLHQTGGAACTPVIATAFPLALGNLGPATSVPVSVTTDFSSCAASARFTLTVVLSANSGATTVTVSNGNQFQ